MPLTLLWLFVIFNHQELTEKVPAQAQSKGSTELASFSNRSYSFDEEGNFDFETSAQFASFEGSTIYPTHQQRTDGARRSVEMCLLQKDFEGKRQWLQSVPDRMARMSGHYLCSTIKAAEVFATAVTVSVQLGLEQLGLLSRRRSYAKDAKRIQGGVATAQIPTSRQRKGERQRFAERAMERTISTQSAERTSKGSRQRQRAEEPAPKGAQ